MKRDNKGSINVLYVEPGDEKQTILNALSTPQERKMGIVIVLPDQSCRAFQSPKDFHDIKLRKRQEDLPIVFVIPNDSLTQWARMNGFAVYSSLETLITSNRVKPSSPPPPSFAAPQRVADPSPFSDAPGTPLYEHDNYPLSFIPPIGSLNQIEEQFKPRISDPITPLPLNADIFPTNDRPPAASFLGNQFTPPTTIPSRPSPSTVPPRLSPAPLPQRPSPMHILRSGRARLFLVLTIVLIVAVLSATLLVTQTLHKTTATSPRTVASAVSVGQMFLSSSGQIDQTASVGVNDIVKVSLTHITSPAQGKKYYVWLRGDSNQSDEEAVYLGSLAVSAQGAAQLDYEDKQHTDMLVSMSRFLITEEDANVVPVHPSLDTTTWRYAGDISQVPDPNDANHLRLLDHLRHLLAAEPSLEALNLHGGLALWLYQNTSKLLEWAQSAQGNQNTNAFTTLQKNVVRILDYLDGIPHVATDVPPRTPVLVDPMTPGMIGLLETSAYQSPASYTQQISTHLTGLIHSPGASANQRQLAIQLSTALNQVQQEFNTARTDAKQLVGMKNKQLGQSQARMLINDLVNQTHDAFIGITDLSTNNEPRGVDWIYHTMHSLATIDIHTYP